MLMVHDQHLQPDILAEFFFARPGELLGAALEQALRLRLWVRAQSLNRAGELANKGAVKAAQVFCPHSLLNANVRTVSPF